MKIMIAVGMTARQSRSLQRFYQRRGCVTWRLTNVYSRQERLGLQYSVMVVTADGTEHQLYRPDERVGGVRELVI
jgi:hypothetical protein